MKRSLASFQRGIFCACILTLCAGCATEPGEKTQIAAATGGVIGAGLGAIVGHQTGSTIGGMAIGAVAGAGTGAMIGNSLDAQQNTLKSQDEVLQRQAQSIKAQRREIDELRRTGSDGSTKVLPSRSASQAKPSDPDHARLAAAYARAHPVRVGEVSSKKMSASVETVSSYKAAPPQRVARAEASQRATALRRVIEIKEEVPVDKTETIDSSGVKERALPTGKEIPVVESAKTLAKSEDDVASSKGAYDWSKSPVSDNAETVATGSSECKGAPAEISQAEGSAETADKLFHYRRALRLCPDNAPYHVKLGDVYQSLNRPSDAAYEYREALNLDPQSNNAREKLAALGR